MGKAETQKEIQDKLHFVSPVLWALDNGLELQAGPFGIEGREFQIDILNEDAPSVVAKKGAQLGVTEAFVIQDLHHQSYGIYPHGALYLFPTETDVSDFSKTRFKPLLGKNPFLQRIVKETDAVNVKNIGGSMLFLRGGRSTSRIDGLKETSTRLKSIPVDCVYLDERDEVSDAMVGMAIERMGDSLLKHWREFSTPSVPGFGIDVSYCVAPDTIILTNELRWRKAKNLKVGDKLIGFDEEKIEGNKTRHYRTTEIKSANRIKLPCLQIFFDDGINIICSNQHKWLREKATNIRWIRADCLKLGDKLFSIGTWKENKTKNAGWLAGIYDGEGCVTVGSVNKNRGYKNGRAARIQFSQKDGLILEKVKKLLSFYGFNFHEGNTTNCKLIQIKGGLPENLRFLGTFRPIRLLSKAEKVWENFSVGNDQGNTKKPKIIKINSVGIQEVIALETTHKTFIANGLLSHNSGSDQRLWMIKCKHCGMETCLEKEFPECLGVYMNKQVFRKCKKCQKNIDPSNGRWVPQYPQRTIHGYWASQLISKRVDPKTILDAYLFPERQIPKTTKTEVMNSKLGMAYIESENQLTEQQVKSCMSNNPMEGRHEGPCAMGVDIGKLLHVVIGIKVEGRFLKILRVAEVPEWNDVHDLARDYNVQCAVFDKYPETHKVREFIKAEPYDSYLCDYSEALATSAVWDINESQVRVNRTEILDKSHKIIADREIELPRISETMETFIKQVVSNVKKLDKRKSTGTPIYRYIERGDDHFRHALNYFLLACTRVSEYRKSSFRVNRPEFAETSLNYLRI